MISKKNNEKLSAENILFCCKEMDFAQRDKRLLLDHEPTQSIYFIRGMFPFHLDVHPIKCCPFCGVNLNTFQTKFKQ